MELIFELKYFYASSSPVSMLINCRLSLSLALFARRFTSISESKLSTRKTRSKLYSSVNRIAVDILQIDAPSAGLSKIDENQFTSYRHDPPQHSPKRMHFRVCAGWIGNYQQTYQVIKFFFFSLFLWKMHEREKRARISKSVWAASRFRPLDGCFSTFS